MNPTRWTALALCILALVAAPFVARGCHWAGTGPSGPDGSTDTSERITPAETRHANAATSAEADSRTLLDQADADAERADVLGAQLAAEQGRTAGLRAALAAARARTDRVVITTPVRVDTVHVPVPADPAVDSETNQLLAARLLDERVAADAVIEQCEARAALSADVATAQAARAASAYAAADSALAALSYSRLAYVEADRRAGVATLLATRRTRQRNLALGVALGLAASCVTLALTR